MSNGTLNNRQTQDPNGLLGVARAGDQSAYAALLEQYAPMIEAMVAKYALPEMSEADKEDLRQEASVVFCSAVQTYDTGREGVGFGLYAKICISNALSTRCRALRHHKNTVLVPVMWVEDSSADETDPGALLMQEESLQLLNARIRTLLSPFECRVWSYYCAGRPAKQIAASLGKDQHSIENAVYRIRRKLFRSLAEKK